MILKETVPRNLDTWLIATVTKANEYCQQNRIPLNYPLWARSYIINASTTLIEGSLNRDRKSVV